MTDASEFVVESTALGALPSTRVLGVGDTNALVELSLPS
jgi:hypothetical protein